MAQRDVIEAKLNNVKSQSGQLEIAKFLEELILKDAEAPTGNENADAALKEEAKAAAVRCAMIGRRLTVRKEITAQLEAELAALPADTTTATTDVPTV